jgi:hypothetical protein
MSQIAVGRNFGSTLMTRRPFSRSASAAKVEPTGLYRHRVGAEGQSQHFTRQRCWQIPKCERAVGGALTMEGVARQAVRSSSDHSDDRKPAGTDGSACPPPSAARVSATNAPRRSRVMLPRKELDTRRRARPMARLKGEPPVTTRAGRSVPSPAPTKRSSNFRRRQGS